MQKSYTFKRVDTKELIQTDYNYSLIKYQQYKYHHFPFHCEHYSTIFEHINTKPIMHEMFNHNILSIISTRFQNIFRLS